MAGLSVLLETQTSFPKQAQILSKTSFLKNASLTSSSAGAAASTHESTFLEQCYLCRIKLLLGEDIYMYRGDRAFCSEECRRRHIVMDEEGGMRDCCSLAAAAPAESRRERAAVRGRALAGSFAY